MDILVLKNIGPKGAPGMPEAGYLPIPRKLARVGVKDMVRISDGRMSGTSYGACILHVAPESFVGGPLAFVQTGDEIEGLADSYNEMGRRLKESYAGLERKVAERPTELAQALDVGLHRAVRQVETGDIHARLEHGLHRRIV
mgnify:CR=1 FL=1